MRNLKKVLSMTLAIVMMLGMMTFAGAAETTTTETTKKVITAADLSDMDKVKNKEEVTLLVDLGVIAGTDKGTFDPEANLSRAQIAKMIYVAKMGTDDKATNFVGAATDLKDVKGHWAEGYINYCYSTGIVSGRGEGVFDPDADVQTVEAAKMLLVALGYDAKDRGYEGDGLWSVNIMQDAKKSGLLADVTEGANVALTRDSTAMMISNTMFAKTITNERQKDFTGAWYISKTYENATTLGQEIFSLVKVSGVVTSATDGKARFDTITPADVALLAGINNAKIPVAGDMIGKKAVIYVKATHDATGVYTFDKVYSSVATAGKSIVLGTSTNGTPIVGYGSAVKTDLTTKKTANKGFIAELDLVTAGDVTTYVGTTYLNGDAKSGNPADLGINAEVLAAAKVVGAVVELIDADNNGKADTIKVTKKIVATLTADPTTKTADDVLQVKVPGVVGLNTFVDAKNVIGYDGLKKDDVVLFYKTDAGVYTIEKAASIEGKVAARKGAEIKIDDTFYGASGLSGFDITTVDTTNTYTFYLDNGKNIVKASQITKETTKEFAVILDAGYVTGSGLGSSAYGQAKLLFTDGTNEIVTVAKVDGVAATSVIMNALKPGTTVDTKTTPYSFFNYTVNDDGKYELTAIAHAPIDGLKITNGAAAFDGKNVGNANTVFVIAIVDGETTSYKTYTGINAVPSLALASADAAKLHSAVVTKDGVATYVFVNTAATLVEGISGDAVYFSVPDMADLTEIPKSGSVPSHFILPIYVDGVLVKDATFSAAAIDAMKALPTTPLFKVSSTNDSGHYTIVADGFTNSVVGVNVVSGGTLSVGPANAPNVYSYDTDTVAYYINAAGEMSEVAVSDLSKDSNDKVRVFATGTTSGLANVVYVKEVNSAVATMKTAVDVTVDGKKTSVDMSAFSTGAGTATDPKTATLKVNDVVAAKSLKLEFAATDAEASVALYAGTVPTTTAAAGKALDDALTYVVTAEDGTVCYYEITLAITSVA